MRTSARTGTVLAVAGAASGLTLLTGGATAQAAATAPTAPHRAAPAKICRYEVTPSIGLNVRKTPNGRLDPPALSHGAHIGADCKSSHNGWVRVWQGVKSYQKGDWVFRRYLKPITNGGGTCRYEVNARHGLNVRKTPNGTLIPPALAYRKHIGADCTASHGGWVRLRQSVPANQIGAWVYKAYLKPITPRGAVSTGGGGTSQSTNPLLAGAGFAVIALGGGIAIAARRRKAKGLA